MTVTDSISTCPMCGASAIEMIRKGISICSECKFVISGNEVTSEPFATLNSGDTSPTSEEEYDDTWKETVDIRDSSDNTLVEMLAATEESIYNLGGTTDDCIRAAETLANVWKQQYFRGRTVSAGIAAIIYTIFRQQGSPRPLKIVAETCDVSEKQLRTGYRGLRADCEIYSEVCPPTSYLPYLASRLNVDEAITQRASELLQATKMETGNPASVAVACVYLATKQSDIKTNITLAEAGDAAGVAKETVWLKTQDIKKATNS